MSVKNDEDRPPFLLRARITKLATDDGMLTLTPEVKVGDIFIVDVASRVTSVLLNQQYKVVHEKDVVQCAETGGWLPIECIEIYI